MPSSQRKTRLDDGEKNRALNKARSLEKSGQLKSAYQEYLRAGAVQEAARLLSNAGKPGDAGRLILSRLKIQPEQMNRLNAEQRKLAYLAATFLAKSDNKDLAVEIFMALGERGRAADILERAGDLLGAQHIRDGRAKMNEPAHPTSAQIHAVGGAAYSRLSAQRLEREGKFELAIKAYVQLKQYGESARILKSLHRSAEAANMYAEGGQPYDAAICYLEAGDTGKGLDNFVRVPRSDPRYRSAATQAVRVATDLNVLSFQLEHFLSEFIATGPADEREFETFYHLSTLYERHGLLENAKEALRKIVAYSPTYRDAKTKLEGLENQTKASPAVYERIRDQEASFRGERRVGAPAPMLNQEVGLPPLPEIPDLPPPPNLTELDIAPNKSSSAMSGASQPAPMSVAVESTVAILPHQQENQSPNSPDAVPLASVQGPNNGQIGSPGTAHLSGAMPVKQSEADFVVGNTIADRYRLDAELGRGGMAVVFQALDLELDEDIALKVFLQQVFDPKMQAESLGRFKQELKLSRQLNHPNIIRLYDIGLHYGHRYISMELLRGKVLEDLLQNVMDLARGLAYLVQICAGLQAAHDKGVVHRDIKPDNLFVTTDEMVKVMDFGIAKNTYGRGLTIEGMTAGTPEYMAPEQISSFSDVTAAADQYSLGLIAYRMFTGKLPFEHEELTPLLVMHLHQQPKPPRELNPDMPIELEKIVLRLLEKDPANRYKSCRELAIQFQQLRANYRRGNS
ncbi:MAG: serine/threonine protein kinase [Proteobacteria bacterium]|nr:serine/threonine protein kinase [Pseudomonadota bacterium]